MVKRSRQRGRTRTRSFYGGGVEELRPMAGATGPAPPAGGTGPAAPSPAAASPAAGGNMIADLLKNLPGMKGGRRIRKLTHRRRRHRGTKSVTVGGRRHKKKRRTHKY